MKTGIVSPQPDSERLTNELDMEFVHIPPGTFMMGSPEEELGRVDNEILHQVRLTKGFFMQTTPVTQKQWNLLVKKNPSKFRDDGDDCPAERVSWHDVQKFIGKMNQRKNAKKYRLPTEAEWEYACRAGTDTAYYFGNDADELERYAWYNENSENRTHPVRQLEPNEWGLYDMHGNVWEWCLDLYGKYSSDSVTDPGGSSSGRGRVIRGGSWYFGANYCRSALRGGSNPDNGKSNLGFRLLMLADM